MDKKACEAKGWIWNEKKNKCIEPDIGTVSFSIPQGSNCDPDGKKRKAKGKKLKKATRLDLLKASAKKGKSK